MTKKRQADKSSLVQLDDTGWARHLIVTDPCELRVESDRGIEASAVSLDNFLLAIEIEAKQILSEESDPTFSSTSLDPADVIDRDDALGGQFVHFWIMREGGERQLGRMLQTRNALDDNDPASSEYDKQIENLRRKLEHSDNQIIELSSAQRNAWAVLRSARRIRDLLGDVDPRTSKNLPQFVSARIGLEMMVLTAAVIRGNFFETLYEHVSSSVRSKTRTQLWQRGWRGREGQTSYENKRPIP